MGNSLVRKEIKFNIFTFNITPSYDFRLIRIRSELHSGCQIYACALQVKTKEREKCETNRGNLNILKFQTLGNNVGFQGRFTFT